LIVPKEATALLWGAEATTTAMPITTCCVLARDAVHVLPFQRAASKAHSTTKPADVVLHAVVLGSLVGWLGVRFTWLSFNLVACLDLFASPVVGEPIASHPITW
jgi:hypothetical protein